MVRVARAQFSGHESKEINVQKVEEDEILYADIDPRVCDDVRELWGFFKFRRPDAYGEVV